ncbi:MAG: DUF5711 family protein [Clostridiales bacterium]|nr:DUF5711 family protein [Clostridiales bacterium]
MKPRRSAVAALAVAAFILAFMNRQTIMKGVISVNAEKYAEFYETGVKFSYGYDAAPSFYSNSDANFYFCTRNGVKYINAATGETVWEDVFTMNAPELLYAGDYVIAGEIGGGTAFVYSPEGRLYEYRFPGAAMSFGVNSSGYSVIIIKTDDAYETRVINDYGLCVWQFRHKDANIYPVSAAVSPDGRIVAVSMLDANSFLSSSVFFAYINSEEAKSYNDTIFASIPKDNQIVALTRFLGESFFCLSNAETGVSRFDAETGLRTNDAAPIENTIDFAGFFGDKGYALCYGDVLPDKDGRPPGSLAFFSASGALLGEWEAGMKATYLSCSKNSVVVGTNRRYFALDSRGKVLWRYAASRDYKHVVCSNNGALVIFASSTEAAIMKRGK